MGKKTALVVILLCALWVGGGLLWSTSGPPEVGVSQFKKEPESYLGRVKVTGRAGEIDSAKGSFTITSEEGCCDLGIAVPTTQAQGERLGTPYLYRGAMPERGDALVAEGVLTRQEAGLRFDLLKLSVKGKVILKRL